MRRIVVGIAVVAVAAELAARITLPAAVVAPESWDAPARDGWCGSVRWQTDADGQRADATARVAAAHANPLVIVGGEFTAAPGLRLEERYPEQLAARARAGGIDAVVALASRQPLALLDEVLTRAPGAAGGPRVIVVELDPAASRGDAARFSVADQLPPLPDPPAGWSRAWDALGRWRRRGERDAAEAEVAALVRHDGWTARATAGMRARLDVVGAAVRSPTIAGEPHALLQALIAELHGLSRTRTRIAATRDFAARCERLRDEQRVLVALVTGPTLPTLGLAQAARDAGHAVIHAPAFEFDPQLRVAAPRSRPAAAVHAMVARSLWATLTRRGLLTGAAAAPADVLAEADAIEQRFESRGGLDEALLTLARAQIASVAPLAGAVLPLAVLHGIDPGGRLVAGRAAELVMRRPPGATELVVRGEAPAGTRPRLRLRSLAGESIDARDEAARVLDGSSARAGHERLEWIFPPPVTRGAHDYPGIELLLAPERAAAASDPPLAAWLHEVALVGPPPGESTGERR